MRIKLQKRRKELKYTQESISIALNISKITYQYIENGKRFPRPKLMREIMKILKTKDVAIFDDENNTNWGDITKNVCEYMNAMSNNKKYMTYHVSTIRNSILSEFKNRKMEGIKIASKTNEGKKEIYERIILEASSKYNFDLTVQDILLYKKCVRQEYTDRTGKCDWGLAEVRQKLGFNPSTGY